MKPLSILSVAYPFAPVAPDTAGGAEQVLLALDYGLTRAGHDSLVIACRGSRTSGSLIELPPFVGDRDPAAMDQVRTLCRRTIDKAIEERPIDVVHMHGIDFHAYMPPPGVPVLATLHLPLSWYPAEALQTGRPGTWFNCVSRSQHESAESNHRMLQPIENGVAVESFQQTAAKQPYALVLARICPEKGIHLAIEAAKRAQVPLLIAGELFPYAAHRRYYEQEVAPRLDTERRWIGVVGPEQKHRLLAEARCVLLPSLTDETSSLVAREAASAGTPAIAFARGALPETIIHGRTGFVVPDVQAMAEAIGRVGELNPETCRAVARERFSADRMIASYIALYHDLSARTRIGGAA